MRITNEPSLKSHHQEIKDEVEKWLKYVTYENNISALGIIAVLAGFLGLSFFSNYLKIIDLVTFMIGIIVTMLVFFAIYFLGLYYGRKTRKYEPETDVKAFYFTYVILTSLNQYDKKTNPNIRKDYLKKAQKNGRRLLKTIQKGWELSEFSLSKKMFENTVTQFIKNFQNIIIPNLEEGKDNVLEKIDYLMYQFAHFLSQPTTLDSLNNINKYITENFDERQEKGQSIFSRLEIMKHSFVVGIIFLIGFIPAIIVYYFGQQSIDNTFMVFSTIFGPLIAVYFTYILRKTTNN